MPEIDGSLDEEDEPEIEKPPEIVPEKPPPPAPWERADRCARNFQLSAMDGRTTVTDRHVGEHGGAEA